MPSLQSGPDGFTIRAGSAVSSGTQVDAVFMESVRPLPAVGPRLGFQTQALYHRRARGACSWGLKLSGTGPIPGLKVIRVYRIPQQDPNHSTRHDAIATPSG